MNLSSFVALGAIRNHYNEDFTKSSSSNSFDYLGDTSSSGIYIDKTYFFVDGYGVVVRRGSTFMILPCSRDNYTTIVDNAACFHKSDSDCIYGDPKSDILLYLRDNGYNIKSSDLLRLSIPAIFKKAYPDFIVHNGYAEYVGK